MDATNPHIAHHLVARHWQGDLSRYGGRAARRSYTYHAYVPDPLANLDFLIPVEVAQATVEAEQAIRALNVRPVAASLDVVARQLLRAESVASSRIEGLNLSQRRLAEAIFSPGSSDATARAVMNNIAAMETAIRIGDSDRPFMLDDLQWIHRTLLNTPGDADIAGVIRTSQNWIGGSDHGPANADFVPPPEDRVPALLDDLCAFVNRDDLPAVMQAAIVHAQFETIHPFADGNGRVGRCLIHVVLRRRGVATLYVPPISVVLAANARRYIDGLTSYRAGAVAEWCLVFAQATTMASTHARALARHFDQLEEEWLERASRPRQGSAARKILALLPGTPIVDAARAAVSAGVSDEAARLAINTLAGAGILEQVNVGKRNRAWIAKDVFAAINAFEYEIATPVTSGQPRRSSPTRRHPTRVRPKSRRTINR